MKTMPTESRNRLEGTPPRRRRTRSGRVARPSVRSRVRSSARALGRRIDRLDRDPRLNRKVKAAAPAVALGGALLGVFVNRWFLAIPIGVGGYLVQRPLRKWVPRILLVARVIHGFDQARRRVRAAFRAAMTDV